MDKSVLAVLHRHWIWIGPPLMVAAVVALVVLIQGTVAVERGSVLVRLPLLETQEITFEEPGPVALAIEGPLGTTRFARVNFELTSLAGELIRGHTVAFRTRSSGFSKARLELMRFDLPWTGGYVLLMSGLGAPQERDAAHSVVFTRPHRLLVAAFVLGIVAASSVFITSLVFLVGRLGETRKGS